MKLDDKQINNLVVVGENNTKEAKINPDKLAKLQYLLTNGLYSDGIGSTVVEITNNALDSIIQSGKDPMANPVYVYIESNPKTLRYQLRIVDNGLGLDENEFENVVMSYLTSTKEDSDDVIGAFGIGAKSWCAVSNTATFICRKNGKEYNFLCYKGPSFLKYDKVYEKDTEEENGVTFILPIKDWSEKTKFIEKAKQKLSYYDNVVLMVDGHVIPNNIYRSEDFQWATLNSNHYLHFSLKDVYYTINFELLGIDPINIPICLRFGLKDGIMPNPSREAIIWTDKTMNLFKDKIKKVADWFAARYNETVKDYSTLLEAWNDIDVDTHYVTIKDKSIAIDSLLRAAGIDVKEPVIKGIELQKNKFYKSKYNSFFYEYDRVAYLNEDGNWSKSEKKWPKLENRTRENRKIVVVEYAPVGRFKTYLQELYEEDVLFVVRRRERKLGAKHTAHGYRQLLNLTDKPKEKWRALIQEWQYVQKTVVSKYEDAVKLETSKDYLDWLEEKKEEAKANRARGVYKGKALNKKKGDITVSFARVRKHHQAATFDRQTIPIANLHKLGHLTVYFNREQSQADNYFIYNALRAFPDVKFAWLNPSEMKHVRHLKTWKTKSQFMFSKPLKRYVTANLISDYLNVVPDKNKNIVFEAFPKFRHMEETLSNYVDKWAVRGDDDLFKELKKTAIDNSLLDMDIYPMLQEFKKVMEDFAFLKYIKEPERWNSSDVERRVLKNMVYILLKDKKINSKMLEDYQLVEVVKDPVPDDEVAYWRPRLSTEGFIAGEYRRTIGDNEVWLKKENLLGAYPKCIPVGLRADDIHDPDVQDPQAEEEELEDEYIDADDVVEELEEEEVVEEEEEEEEEDLTTEDVDEDDELRVTDSFLEKAGEDDEDDEDLVLTEDIPVGEDIDEEEEEELDIEPVEVEPEEGRSVAVINLDEPELQEAAHGYVTCDRCGNEYHASMVDENIEGQTICNMCWDAELDEESELSDEEQKEEAMLSAAHDVEFEKVSEMKGGDDLGFTEEDWKDMTPEVPTQEEIYNENFPEPIADVEPETVIDVVESTLDEHVDEPHKELEVEEEEVHHTLGEMATEEFTHPAATNTRIESGIPLPKGTRMKPKVELPVEVSNPEPIKYDTNLDEQYYNDYL